jgi:outer membrane immunogenic protein
MFSADASRRERTIVGRLIGKQGVGIMKRLFLLFACLFAVALPNRSMAADMEPPYLKAPPLPVLYNWTGFYIGVNGGGGSSTQNFNGTQVTPVGSTGSGGNDGLGGGLAGGQIGFNYQFASRVVVGLEADADWSNYTNSGIAACSTFTTGLFTGLPAGCATNNETLNDFGTVRGRLGYAWNRVLFYGTGGWAWGRSSGNSTPNCLGIGCPAASLPFTGGTASFANSFSGWAAGAGVEWAFLPNWTIRLEYLFLQFDGVATNYTTITTPPLGTGTTTTHVTSNNGVNVWRAGISYLFNFGGPEPAMVY